MFVEKSHLYDINIVVARVEGCAKPDHRRQVPQHEPQWLYQSTCTYTPFAHEKGVPTARSEFVSVGKAQDSCAYPRTGSGLPLIGSRAAGCRPYEMGLHIQNRSGITPNSGRMRPKISQRRRSFNSRTGSGSLLTRWIGRRSMQVCQAKLSGRRSPDLCHRTPSLISRPLES